MGGNHTGDEPNAPDADLDSFPSFSRLLPMDPNVQQFFDELQEDPEVLALILFGSYARGNGRPDSDIDLLVIIASGETTRRIETKAGKSYEMIWVTESAALEYWQNDRDGCYGVWKDAKIVFDKNGAAERLRLEAKKIIAEGKRELTDLELAHEKFNAEDQLRAIKKLAEEDPAAANHVLHHVMARLVELFFDIKRLWAPPPKKALHLIRRTNPKLGDLLDSFYSPKSSFQRTASLAEQIIQEIFNA